MGRRLAALAPLGLSLAAHAALIGGLAGADAVTTPAAPPAPVAIPVSRAADAPPPLRVVSSGESKDPGAAPAEAVIPLDTADPRYRPYLTVVKERIWRRWDAPRIGAGRAARGSLVVEFSLTREGGLAAVEVREPSGQPPLDRAALDAIVRAAPFAPLPAAVVAATLRVRARFVYE